METTRQTAEGKIRELLQEAFSGARVFQGGGNEILGTDLQDMTLEAATNALQRLYPQFHIADHAGWPKVYEKAQKGRRMPSRAWATTASPPRTRLQSHPGLHCRRQEGHRHPQELRRRHLRLAGRRGGRWPAGAAGGRTDPRPGRQGPDHRPERPGAQGHRQDPVQGRVGHGVSRAAHPDPQGAAEGRTHRQTGRGAGPRAAVPGQRAGSGQPRRRRGSASSAPPKRRGWRKSASPPATSSCWPCTTSATNSAPPSTAGRIWPSASTSACPPGTRSSGCWPRPMGCRAPRSWWRRSRTWNSSASCWRSPTPSRRWWPA